MGRARSPGASRRSAARDCGHLKLEACFLKSSFLFGRPASFTKEQRTDGLRRMERIRLHFFSRESMNLYFRVLKSSPVMKILERSKKEMETHRSGILKFLKEQGFPKSQETWGTQEKIFGLRGDVQKPGWRYNTRHRRPYSSPALKTPEGRAIAAKMKEIPNGPDMQSVSQEIFNHGLVMGSMGEGLCIHYATFGWSKRGVICVMDARVKKEAKTWPKGLKEITGTEAAKINGEEL